MKNRQRPSSSVLQTVIIAAILALPAGLPAQQIGAAVAGFRLVDTAGREHSLEVYTGAGKVVLFELWSFKCPVSLAYDKRMAALEEKYRDRGVVVLGVASNSDESPEALRRNVASLRLPFPVLLDKDGDLMGKLGATHAPSIYIIDRNRLLRYRGALDNNKEAGEKSRVAYAEDALEAVLAGRTVGQPETKVLGCNIKRKVL